MDNGARIRINRETGEVEISGSEQFVNDNIGLVQSVLNITPSAPAAKKVTKVEEKPAPAAAPAAKATKVEPEAKPVKRGRGRPKKSATATPVATKPKPTVPRTAKPKRAASSPAKAPKVASSFSAYMKSFKRKMKKGDWILAAGYYFQTSTSSDTFSTFNTSKLLKSQGVELANPSQYMKNNVSSGRIEAVGKRAYKVTNEGEKYLAMLMTKK